MRDEKVERMKELDSKKHPTDAEIAEFSKLWEEAAEDLREAGCKNPALALYEIFRMMT